DVVTCRPDEALGNVRPRVEASGLDVCVVTNEEGIVFGVLGAEELAGADDVRAEGAMRPGPSTFRPNVPIQEMADYMTDHALASAPVTTSDGKLIGLLMREDAVRAARGS